jgi:hypothetical protein
MSTSLKRATVYLNPQIHKALKLKSAELETSVSDLINEALKASLIEDSEDLQAFSDRKLEPTVSFETFVKKLKRDGKI